MSIIIHNYNYTVKLMVRFIRLCYVNAYKMLKLLFILDAGILTTYIWDRETEGKIRNDENRIF